MTNQNPQWAGGFPDDSGLPLGGPSASLTYEPFYGLSEKPFSLSSDPRFLFKSAAHAPAFEALSAGIRRREGLIVLTGEIGTGKTTLCRSVLQHLDRRTFAAFVPDPFVSREDLLKMLLVDFGAISIGDLKRGRLASASRLDLSYLLYDFLDSLVPLQAFAVVVIDEAQNLPLPLLEEIRILSDLERREKLLQIVLVGQPELRSALKLTQMRQVEQRVSVRCELAALDTDGVAGYVNHRLAVASDGRSRAEFTPASLDVVYQGSSGVPRLINRICDRALQRAYTSRIYTIDPRFVWEALDDLELTPIPAVETPVVPDVPAPSIEPPPVYVEPPASYVESPVSYVEPPASYVESPTSYVESPTSYVESPTSYVESPALHVEPPAPYVEPPAPYVETRASYVETPASYVQAAPAPAARPAVHPATPVTEEVPEFLAEFAAEADLFGPPGGLITRFSAWHRWATVALAVFLGMCTFGGSMWYLNARTVSSDAVRATVPALPPRPALSHVVTRRILLDATLLPAATAENGAGLPDRQQ